MLPFRLRALTPRERIPAWAGKVSSRHYMHFGENGWLLEVTDYNELVGSIPKGAWVDAQSPEVLQGLLDTTDVVSFPLSSRFTHEDREIVNEAAEDLAAARWAQQQNRAGAIDGLDGAVHSIDAEEFLAQLKGVDCLVHAGVKPFFTPVPDYEAPTIGKRLVIAVMPATPVAP